MKNILRKAKKGFTIVELVIVIGVIAILSAILIPTFVNLTDKANDAALQSNLANAYTEYYAAALDDDNIEDVARIEVFLSVNDTASAAKNKYYQCDSEGKWAEKTSYTVAGKDFASVYKTGTPEAYGGYYVYFAVSA